MRGWYNYTILNKNKWITCWSAISQHFKYLAALKYFSCIRIFSTNCILRFEFFSRFEGLGVATEGGIMGFVEPISTWLNIAEGIKSESGEISMKNIRGIQGILTIFFPFSREFTNFLQKFEGSFEQNWGDFRFILRKSLDVQISKNTWLFYFSRGIFENGTILKKNCQNIFKKKKNKKLRFFSFFFSFKKFVLFKTWVFKSSRSFKRRREGNKKSNKERDRGSKSRKIEQWFNFQFSLWKKVFFFVVFLKDFFFDCLMNCVCKFSWEKEKTKEEGTERIQRKGEE